MSKSWRKLLILSAKLLLAAGLLVWVLREVDWPKFLKVLAESNRWLLVLGVACQGASVLLISYRWWRLVKVQGIRLSLWEAVRLTFLGTFFNQIVLGTTGGDLVKAWYLSRHHPSKTTCLITVLVDRVLGLTGLTLLSAIMLTWLWIAQLAGIAAIAHPAEMQNAALLCAAILVALAAGCVLLFSRRLRRWLRLERAVQRMPMASKFMHANKVLHRYRHRVGAVTAAMGETFLAQVAFIGCLLLVGMSLGLSVPWYAYFVYIPLIYIIAAIPIVPGGLGLAEGSFAYFFASWESDPSRVFALAFLARLIPIFWALPGILVAVAGPRLPAKAEMEADLAAPTDTVE